MSKTRPELSKNNKYYLNKHRYYELKHYCLQYNIWKKALEAITSLSGRSEDLALFHTNELGSPTERCALARLSYISKMNIVEEACKKTDEFLWEYILLGVTEEIPYDVLRVKYNIPCCKDVYYDAYRRFFWELNKLRE